MAKPRSKFKKVKWLFGKEIEIPEEWEWSELGKEGNLASGATPSRNHPEYYKGSIPWVSSGELDYNIIKYTHEAITLLAVRKTNLKIHPKDTFLFAITGLEAKGTRGRCAILGINAATNQSCMAFNESDSLSPKFLFYYFLLFGEKIIFSLAQGTKQQSLNLHLSTKIQIPIPEHKEQEKIVSILSGVDALIESTQEVIAKTERLKKGLMQKLLTKGIGHTKFKKVKWLFGKELEIPEEWDTIFISAEFKLKTGGTPSRTQPRYFDGDIHWVTSTDLNRSSITSTLESISWDAKEITRLEIFQKGTFVIATYGLEAAGTRGKCGVLNVNATINQACLAFIPTGKITTKFLFYFYLKYGEQIAFNYAQGTKQQNLYPGIVGKISITKPPIPEQKKIASILSGVDAYIQKNQEYKKKIELLKKGLMQKLLTGQIRVKVDH